MSNFNSTELTAIKECVCSQITISSKFLSYANKVSDSDLKQMFKNASKEAEQYANKLTQLL